MSLRLLLWAKLGILKDLSFIYPNKSDDFQGSVIMPKSLEPLQAVYPDSEWWVAKDTSDYELYARAEVAVPLILSFDLRPKHGERISGLYYSAKAAFRRVDISSQWHPLPIKRSPTVQELIELNSATELEFFTFVRRRCKLNRIQRQKIMAHLKYLGYKGLF